MRLQQSHMSPKIFAIPSALALAAALTLGSLGIAYAGRDGGNDAHQTYLDEQYARNHPTIVPGAPPGITEPGSAYGYVPRVRMLHWHRTNRLDRICRAYWARRRKTAVALRWTSKGKLNPPAEAHSRENAQNIGIDSPRTIVPGAFGVQRPARCSRLPRKSLYDCGL
jgi:hypothetical protein